MKAVYDLSRYLSFLPLAWLFLLGTSLHVDAATRLTSAVIKDTAENILKTHGWQYDPGNNRIATKTDATGLIPTRHNKLNQLLTHGSGPVRFAGALDEPGTVTVNGQDAKMRNQALFEAYLDLPPGTHEVEIAATDHDENTATQTYELEIANEPETQFEYDLNGNLTTKTTATGTTTYQWDALDRLITIIRPDTSRSEFTYDGLSRRVRIIEKDATATITSDKRHLWDDLQIAEERATDGSTVTKRFYPYGVELVTGPSAGTYTYRTDHLGSIREIVDSAGTLAARYDYTAWGEPELVSGAFDLDFRYTGHYHHQPSALHLAPFRAYDATTARWINRDPIQEDGGVNLYSYVEGDPVNYWDPDGLLPSVVSNYQHNPIRNNEEWKAAAAGWAVGTAGGSCILAAGALPTASIAIGPGTQVSSAFPGFHVAFGSGGNWLHATGAPWAMRVLGGRRAMEFATKEAWLRIPIPVISAAAVNSTKGPANFCVTAAARGIARGWVNPVVDYLKNLFN